MKLYEAFGTGGFHSTVITTFGIDFEAFENIALSRLRSAGCRNNILITDRVMLDQALSGGSSLPELAGRVYSVVGAKARGVFHSKLIIQLGRKRARLLIGSANATAAGIAGNLELMGCVDCEPENPTESDIIRKAWTHIEARVDGTNQSVLHQLHWAQARSPWLFGLEPISGTESAVPFPEIDFLSSNAPESILDRFVRNIGDDEISELVILSPYWDSDLRALSELIERLQPSETILLIDPEKALFPGHALNKLEDVRLVDIGQFAKDRFVHAKLILARSGSADHVLFGSANCTAAALGYAGKAGTNDESCLYRRLPVNELLDRLNLLDVLDRDDRFEPMDLPAFRIHDDVSEDHEGRRHPGRFELIFDKLIWHPLQSTSVADVSLELLDSEGNELVGNLVPTKSSSDSVVQFELHGFESRPSFARVVFPDSGLSAPAVVMSVADLRDEVRETSVKRSKYDPQLLTGEAEEGLWLIEALNDLEDLEVQQREDFEKVRRAKRVSEKPDEANPEAFRRLGYSEFIAGRKLKPAKLNSGRNSLAGTEASLVREYLNRLLAVGLTPSGENTEESEDDMDALFDQGDSVHDPEASIESGEEFSQPVKDPFEKWLKELPQTVEEKRYTQRRNTRSQLEHAVVQFRSTMRSRAASKSLSNIDLLRLRAMLTVLAAAGFAGSHFGDTSSIPTSLQVLPVNNVDDDWPHLVGQVLFAFFGGKHPLIDHLQIEDIYDQVPDDIYECWLMCVWVACACLSINLHSERISVSLERILARIYENSGLTLVDVLSDSAELFLMSLNDRFAVRLGFNGDILMSIHESRARNHFNPASENTP